MADGESSSKVGLGLAIGGVVVVALAAVLYIALRKDLGREAHRGPATPSEGSAVATHSPSAPTVTPGLPGDKPQLPQPAPGENPRDYVVGDIRVRDHREGDNKPLDIPPNVHPMEGPQIPSTLTHEVSQKVRQVMTECTASLLPKDARGDKPRVEGQIMISIKAHKVTITKATMQVRNATGESVEPTKQCIESKSVGIENPAPDQSDLDNYSINVSYAIP